MKSQIAALVCSAFMSITVLGGGFQLNLQSIKALGMGGASAAWARDASVVFLNPGAMSALKGGHHFTFGINHVMPSVSLQTPVNYNINQTTGTATPFHFYYSGSINDKLSVGFLVNNQYGSSSSFADDWEGRYIIQNISLRTFMFQPTASYLIHEKLSVGAGFVVATGNFSTEKAVPVSSTESLYGKARLEGGGTTVGFNAGIHSALVDNDKMTLNLGVSYRSKMKLNLEEGEAYFTDIPTSLQYQFPEQTGFTGGLTLPDVWSFGATYTYKISEDIAASALVEINRTGWSSYDTLAFDFENPDTPDATSLKLWQDTYTYRAGLDLEFFGKYSIRAGIYKDNTPIKDGYVSPELPDGTHIGYTAGISVAPVNYLSIDVAFLRQSIEREAELYAAEWTAKYRRQVNIISVGVNVLIGGKDNDDAADASFE